MSIDKIKAVESFHLKNLLARAPALEPCMPDIVKAYSAMRDSLSRGGTLLLCGNGGSAADCEHWAGELLKGFASKRPLPADIRQKLPGDLGTKLQGAIRAIPLTGFLSLATAFANDVDPHLTFAQLVYGIGRPGDVLVGISTSGNSVSVCTAIETANAMGLITVGLTGQTGGRLAGLASIAIKAPSPETYRIQEYHLPIYHCLCLMLEEEFFPQ